MHAGVRFQLASYAGWNRQEWDLPINQEDMAATLLSFSYITMDGLRRLGYVLTDEETEAYLHTWNIVGHILGIRPEMLAANYADAAALIARVSERQFAPSEEGRMMTRALVDMMRHEIPGNLFDRAPELLIRYFLGARVAEMVGVSAGEISELIAGPLRLVAQARSKLLHDSTELARIHELVNPSLANLFEKCTRPWHGSGPRYIR